MNLKSLTKVLEAKFLHSLIDESKYNRYNTVSIILKTINGLFYTTTDLSSANNPISVDFRKPVEKLEQGKIAIILEQTKGFLIFKHLLHIKIIYQTQILNKKKKKLFIYEKTPNVKEKPSFKKGCNGCR